MKLLVVPLCSISFLSCSLLEPTAINHFKVKQGTPVEQVFVCTESTINHLKSNKGTWDDAVTTRDIQRGIFETGKFKHVNIMGIRMQLTYNPVRGDGYIKVKASGPYFSDLGASEAVLNLRNGIVGCLKH